MSGRWNNRGEGKRGEKNEPEKGGKKTHTQARKQWFYPNVSVGFGRKKMRLVVSCYFQDACVVVVIFNIRTLLCGGAHTTEASRGLLPRGVRPQERDAETREAVMSRSGCKERQGGQWRAHYPLPGSVDRAGEQGDVRAARTQDRAARLSRRCHDTEFIRGNE